MTAAAGSDPWRLVPFDPALAAQVAGWAITADDARNWCSHDGHPVPVEVVAGWGDEPDCLPFALVGPAGPVGYGELWLADDGSEVELGRLIVDPASRGRGVGAALTRALVDRARRESTEVFLRVRPDNVRARTVYERVGFRRVAADLETAWNQGQPVAYIWMQHRPTTE